MNVDGPRPARLDELGEVIRLTDAVFRTADGLAPTMGDEFPLFLCADNIDHLYIIRREDAVVSHVGVYEQTMMLRGTSLRVACVGSVCTHLEHRSKGYAGSLMDLAIDADVNGWASSGTGSLGDRRGRRNDPSGRDRRDQCDSVQRAGGVA